MSSVYTTDVCDFFEILIIFLFTKNWQDLFCADTSGMILIIFKDINCKWQKRNSEKRIRFLPISKNPFATIYPDANF